MKLSQTQIKAIAEKLGINWDADKGNQNFGSLSTKDQLRLNRAIAFEIQAGGEVAPAIASTVNRLTSLTDQTIDTASSDSNRDSIRALALPFLDSVAETSKTIVNSDIAKTGKNFIIKTVLIAGAIFLGINFITSYSTIKTIQNK